MTALDVRGNTNLRYLMANNLGISSIDLSNNANLVVVRLNYNSELFGDLDFSHLPQLEQLWIRATDITSVNVSGLTELEVLSLSQNENMHTVNTSGAMALRFVEIHLSADSLISGQITSFDASGLENLEVFRAAHQQLTTLVFHPNAPLRTVSVRNNNLQELDVSMMVTTFVTNHLIARGNDLQNLIIPSTLSGGAANFTAQQNNLGDTTWAGIWYGNPNMVVTQP